VLDGEIEQWLDREAHAEKGRCRLHWSRGCPRFF
jgi:hypothetical protein